MSEAIQLDGYVDGIRSDSYPSRAVVRKSGGSGGDMDDVLKRLGAVESSVSELRVQVSGMAATLPYLATKDDLKEVKGEVAAIAAIIPHLATKADVSDMESKIIKWIIATVLTTAGLTAGLAFSIAKFVH